jgi:sensor histidine kinase YesM
MKLPGSRGSLSRSFVSIVIAISLVLLGGQLLLQRFFVGYVGRIYQANADTVTERMTHEVQATFSEMNNAVGYIAEHPNVLDYVTTTDTSQRYRKAFEAVRPIVDVATRNLGFDQILVSDSTDSWYRFQGSLSNASCQVLKELIGKSWGTSNIVITLEGSTYFCTGRPIVLIRDYKPSIRGFVVAMTDVGKTRKLLKDYGSFKGLEIRLHDFSRVLVSNVPGLEGRLLADLDKPRDKYYSRSGPIIPGSLGITISIPRNVVFPQQALLGFTILSVGIFALITLGAAAILVNRNLVGPLVKVTEGTRNIDEKDLSQRLAPTGVAYVDTLVAGINNMLGRLEEYNGTMLAARQTLYESELNRQKIQMHLLKTQIDGHFLYNSLISIKSLADQGETRKAGEVSSGIAQLLRYTSSPDEEVNLFDEMDIVQLYVRIQNIRFADKFRLELDVDDRLCEYRILRLLIQPIVENALIHGLEGQSEPAALFIRGRLEADGIHIEIEDEGVGIPAERLAELQANIRRSSGGGDIDPGIEGVALTNIQKRIALAYGKGYGLEVSSEEGRFTRVSVFLPAVGYPKPDEGGSAAGG